MREFVGKGEQELQKLLLEREEALREFRFGMSGGKIKNIKLGKEIRKDIARILTELSARRRGRIDRRETRSPAREPTA